MNLPTDPTPCSTLLEQGTRLVQAADQLVEAQRAATLNTKKAANIQCPQVGGHLRLHTGLNDRKRRDAGEQAGVPSKMRPVESTRTGRAAG